jgi:hypothetical protein
MRESMVMRCVLVPAASACSSSSINDVVMAVGGRSKAASMVGDREETIAAQRAHGGREPRLAAGSKRLMKDGAPEKTMGGPVAAQLITPRGEERRWRAAGGSPAPRKWLKT